MSDTQTAVDPGEAPAVEPKAKRARPTRVDFPVPEGGFDEWPAEWDETKHRGLLRHSFKDERKWLAKKIEQAKADITRFEAEIERITNDGPTKRSGGSKLAAVTSELDALRKLLASQGIDIDELKRQQEAAK